METEETKMEDFMPVKYTFKRSFGAFKYAIPAMFKTFRAVEDVIDSHFSSPNHIFFRDGYDIVL